MNTPYVFKKCSKCDKWLVASTVNFYKKKHGKYGLNSYCKKCKAEYDKHHYEDNKDYYKQYRKDNKDKIKQYYEDNKYKILGCKKQYYENNKDYYKQWRKDNKDYYKQYSENNKDKIVERHKQYYEDNKDKILKYNKQYRTTPQGQVVAFNKNCRRRLKEQNLGNGITSEQWLECMTFFDWKCAYSGKNIGGNNSQSIRSLDHIVPLNKNGEHQIWNVVPMYRPYNSSKHDKDILEWYKEQPFFNEERLQKIYEWQAYAFTKYGK